MKINDKRSPAHKLIDFFALNKGASAVLLMVVLIGTGEKMGERFLPIYLIALGGGPIIIGLLQALDNLLSALYSFPGGYISDRFGVKRALFIFNIIAMIGFSFVALVPSWKAVIIGAVLFISWSSISQPATISLIFKILPQNKRVMGTSVFSLVKRLPMAIGPLIGGTLISIFGESVGIRLSFGVAFFMTLISLIVQHKFIDDDFNKTKPVTHKNPLKLYRVMHKDLKNLLIIDILIRFCEQIPYAFVVVWCMQTIANPISAFQFAILTTIEMLTATLIYIPVASFADKHNKKPFILITFIFFSLFPLVLLFSNSMLALVFAFILRGLKEFGEPTRKALIMELSPDNSKAAMFGCYYLIRDIFVSVAAFGGAFLWKISPQTNLITAFIFGIIATISFAFLSNKKNKHIV